MRLGEAEVIVELRIAEEIVVLLHLVVLQTVATPIFIVTMIPLVMVVVGLVMEPKICRHHAWTTI